MVKIIIFCTKIMLTLVALILMASCNGRHNFVKGSGNVVSVTRNISQEFTGISVSNGLEVIVLQADQSNVVVEADDNIGNRIATKVIDGVLIISSDFNSYTSHSTTKITVTMPNIKNLSASRGSNLHNDGIITGDDVTINAESGSLIQIAIESDRISVQSSGGSNVEMSGKALNMSASASGGSNIDADDLLANEVKVTASSGSNVDIHAILNLEAKATGGSSIEYKVQPKHLEKIEGSGSNISLQ